jgi:hypothetical protein
VRWYYYVGLVMVLAGTVCGMVIACVTTDPPTTTSSFMIVGSVAIILAGCLLVSFMERRNR